MALVAREVGFGYRRAVRVLRAVSCTIEPGAITAIVGPNGAGKSTLLRLLAGLREPNDGRVTLDGRDLRTLGAHDRAKRVAYLAQRATLAFEYDVARVVGFGRYSAGADESPARAIERFGLGDLARVPFGTLSVGQQQRVSLARVWAQLDGCNEGYLLGDEPFASMDPRHAAEGLGAMREFARRGVGVAVVLHDLSSACTIADRAVVLGPGGVLAGEGGGDEVLSETRLSAVYGVSMRKQCVEGIGTVVGVADAG